eukprot:scaffold262601_cov16-Tisochrysis_lutea.AAC.1
MKAGPWVRLSLRVKELRVGQVVRQFLKGTRPPEVGEPRQNIWINPFSVWAAVGGPLGGWSPFLRDLERASPRKSNSGFLELNEQQPEEDGLGDDGIPSLPILPARCAHDYVLMDGLEDEGVPTPAAAGASKSPSSGSEDVKKKQRGVGRRRAALEDEEEEEGKEQGNEGLRPSFGLLVKPSILKSAMFEESKYGEKEPSNM